jgi:hypothetical protein
MKDKSARLKNARFTMDDWQFLLLSNASASAPPVRGNRTQLGTEGLVHLRELNTDASGRSRCEPGRELPDSTIRIPDPPTATRLWADRVVPMGNPTASGFGLAAGHGCFVQLEYGVESGGLR